jgi:hypothetical protein
MCHHRLSFDQLERMQKKYIGKNRTGNLDWLLNQWLPKGPPVCFLEGFLGVGKTDLARDFRALASKQGNWQQAVIDEVADRPTSSVLESMMELSEKLSQQGLPEMEEILLGEANPNIAFALEKALRRPVVIILDESQRFFVKDSGSPLPEWNAVLAHLRNRPTLSGRLLLLSDRMVEHARWSEAFPIRTLALRKANLNLPSMRLIKVSFAISASKNSTKLLSMGNLLKTIHTTNTAQAV